MEKAERDHLMTRLSQTERDQCRRFIQDVRTRAAVSGLRVTARQVLTSQGHTVSPALRAALEAVVARDEMGPQVGTYPPDFYLKRLGTAKRVRLSSFRGQWPVALVFGSYTCPPFRAQVGRMEDIYRRYRDHIAFFVVYVQEAHPTDGWQVERNVADGVLFRQHQSYDEREVVAATCSLDLDLSIPVLVEEMDNAIDEAYGAAPERLYLIGADGRVAYHGGAGPHFFDLEVWEQAIAASVRPVAAL
jgi:hypothetical protein